MLALGSNPGLTIDELVGLASVTGPLSALQSLYLRSGASEYCPESARRTQYLLEKGEVLFF